MHPQAFKARYGLDTLTADIPPELVLNEPEGGIGFSYDDGRFVSSDIVRLQKVVNTLYRNDVLSRLSTPNDGERKSVLEIGAGYAGLAHHLSRILGNITVVIVDLPEMLLFSGPYLTLLNPDKRIYIYDGSDFSEFIDSSEAKTYDFILVPNYRLQSLREWRFDLAINVNSFQEMREAQVDEYLNFVSETCTGVLYSVNVDRHPGNSELFDFSEMLSARFDLTEVLHPKPPEKLKIRLRKALRSAATSAGLLDRPRAEQFPPARELIYTPRKIRSPEPIGR